MKLVDKIELVPVENIFPYMNNAKKHPEEQIDKIASSIKNYGFTVPIVIDDSGEIIAGHGRYRASTERLGLQEVPCIVRDDLNEAQIKALRLADNKVAESEWDYESLAIELDELDAEDFDLELTGFDEHEIEEIKMTDFDIFADAGDIEEEYDEPEDEEESKELRCPNCNEIHKEEEYEAV